MNVLQVLQNILLTNCLIANDKQYPFTTSHLKKNKMWNIELTSHKIYIRFEFKSSLLGKKRISPKCQEGISWKQLFFI